MYIERIAYHLNERSEVPNQELAKELAESNNVEGIQEIGSYLHDKNKSIASDCLKVIYEIGYINPTLITDYKDTFIEFLNHKNNRMVWGSMIGLANVALVEPHYIHTHIDLIKDKIKNGTTITHVWGIYTIVNLIEADSSFYEVEKDYLFELQSTCRPIDFYKRAETISKVVQDQDIEQFINILRNPVGELSNSAQKKLDKLINKLESK
jgi:hypothetical protein